MQNAAAAKKTRRIPNRRCKNAEKRGELNCLKPVLSAARQAK